MDGTDWFPIPGIASPPFQVLPFHLLLGYITPLQNSAVLSDMQLLESDKLNGAVTVFLVISIYKPGHPAPCFVERAKRRYLNDKVLAIVKYHLF